MSLGEKHVEIRRYVGVCEKRAEMKTGGERFEIESTFICADILTAQIESYRIWHGFFFRGRICMTSVLVAMEINVFLQENVCTTIVVTGG